MAQRGIELAQTELGVDRPDKMEALHDQITDWLNS